MASLLFILSRISGKRSGCLSLSMVDMLALSPLAVGVAMMGRGGCWCVTEHASRICWGGETEVGCGVFMKGGGLVLPARLVP